jgi:hypothetical protein
MKTTILFITLIAVAFSAKSLMKDFDAHVEAVKDCYKNADCESETEMMECYDACADACNSVDDMSGEHMQQCMGVCMPPTKGCGAPGQDADYGEGSPTE